MARFWHTVRMSLNIWCQQHRQEFFFSKGDAHYLHLKWYIDYLMRNAGQDINRLTPNDPYMGRTAPLTSKRCILYIYSTNIGTEYFKHALYSQFFPSSKCILFHNANLFGSCIIHILNTGCAKIKKNNSGAKGLTYVVTELNCLINPYTKTVRNSAEFSLYCRFCLI